MTSEREIRITLDEAIKIARDRASRDGEEWWTVGADVLTLLADAAEQSRRSPTPERDAVEAALTEAERFLDYFANNRTEFVGGGTPASALEIVRAAIRSLKSLPRE